MSDVDEVVFAARHKATKESQIADAGAALKEAGINWSSNNHGVHMIISHNNITVDFWPTTGLWLLRGQRKRNYGVRSLVRQLKPVAGEFEESHGGRSKCMRGTP